MTTITDTMRTVAGDPDNSEVVFFVPEMRPAASGTATVTMKRVPITPVNGAFTVTLDPGLVYAQIGSGRSPFVVPASGTARMGTLIAQYLPPTSTPTQVDAAIAAWLEDNPLPGGSGLDQAAVDTRVQTVGDNRYAPLPILQLGIGTADDTDRINAAAEQARTLGGCVIAGLPGEIYTISDTIVLGSDVSLDLRFSDLLLVNGSNCQMVTNYGSRYPVATGTGSTVAGSNVVTSPLAAQAQVGQYFEVKEAAANGHGTYIGMIGAKTSTTLTLFEMDGITPYKATATVNAKAARLGRLDSRISVRIRNAMRGANGPDGGTSTPANPSYGSGVAGHSIFLRGVEHFDVEIENATSTGGISFVWPTIARHGRVQIHDSNVVRTALQVVGPIFDIQVPIVRGKTNDDLVNYCGNVYPDQTDTCGNVRGITTGDLVSRGVGGCVLKLNAGQGLWVDDITVSGQLRGVGAGGGTAVIIGEDTYYPETTGGDYGHLDLGRLTTHQVGGAQLALTGANIQYLKLGITPTRQNPILVGGDSLGYIDRLDLDISGEGDFGTLMQIYTGGRVEKLNITGSVHYTANGHLVNVWGTGKVGVLTVDGLRLKMDGTDSAVVACYDQAEIDTVAFRDCDIDWANTNAGLHMIRAHAVMRKIIIDGGRYQRGAKLVFVNPSATVETIHINDPSIHGSERLGEILSSCAVWLNGIRHVSELLNPAFYVQGAIVSLHGDIDLLSTGGGYATDLVQAGSGAQVRPYSLGVRVNLSAMMHDTVGMLAWNMDGALPCGVGPVVYTSTGWKNLATGDLYAPA